MDSCKRECSIKVDLLTGDVDYSSPSSSTDSSSSTLHGENSKDILRERDEPHVIKKKNTCGGDACGVHCGDLLDLGVTDW